MSVARTSRSWSRTRAFHQGRRRNSMDPQQSGEPSSSQNGGSYDYQRFIVTDPIASRYLQHDSCVTVLEQRREITTYQAGVVEQWATSRNHPTFTVTIHTGDQSDKIVASILGIPKDESVWSQRLRIYFRALNHAHARRRDTSDGVLMVTSLSGFPSSLTLIPVPGGDVSQHYADFFVNEDLKRLGCSGRVGLTLTQPNASTVAKYHQLYRTNDKNSLYSSVIELVRMCQVALHIFGVLDQEYIDGLLCDVTENAISRWWAVFGMDVYHTSPRDGILGPTTVAALLGLLLGARNRLNSLGVQMPKDPFDAQAMKKGIWSFQKTQRLQRNRRLDELTLRKLHDLTEKAAQNEGGWRVPKTLKTTVAELSGKGEELANDGAGRKSKSGIADVETTAIDSFAQLAYGERCRWLWHGKSLKKTNTAMHGEALLDGILLPKSPERNEADRGRHGHRVSDGRSRTSMDDDWSEQQNRSPRRSLDEGHSQHLGSSAVRRVHGVFDDGRAELNRFFGAVNPMKREGGNDRAALLMQQRAALPPLKRPPTLRSQTSPASPTTSPIKHRASPLSTSTHHSSNEFSRADAAVIAPPSTTTRDRSPEAIEASKRLHTAIQSSVSLVPDVSREARSDGRRVTSYHGVNLDEYLPVPRNPEQDIPPMLRRTQSASAIHRPEEFRGRRYHGRLSFSLAEGSITMTNGRLLPQDIDAYEEEDIEFVRLRFVGEHVKSVRQSIKNLSRYEAAWTTSQMERLETLVQQASRDQDELQSMLDGPARASHELQEMAALVLQDEQEILNEGRRELETLAAKLDYELNLLEGKIEDVEQGVVELDRALQLAENRVDDVERDVLGRSGWGCAVM